MTAAALVCGSCGTELPPNSKFCNECGAAVATATTPAEYKQVTVLFADVGHCQLEQSEGDFRRFASAIHQVACDV